MADGEDITYQYSAVEKKWQKYWLEAKTFRAIDLSPRPKYYVLDMFPYPSGDGLHVGHPLGYTATDIISRFKRARGFNVLHPMGWDAFGLPAEQHAMKTGTHPQVTTDKNIRRFREQIQMLGLSYDWEREINTCTPDYYRWTQWIFRKLFEKGLAYESFAPVNWCPELGTVLANEEVIDGKSERGGYPVIKKPMRQWVLKITEYAERLLSDLEGLDWPEAIKEMQRHWIGKSIGADIDFAIKGHKATVRVFTTRADTLFGATFMVLAPDHPLVDNITTAAHKAEVSRYQTECQSKTDMERTSADREKTGVFIGAYAINPANQAEIPIYIADYVLATYGHGAIMAVPAHDERDHAFAKKYGISIKQVLEGGSKPVDEAAHVGDGTLIGSGFLDGLQKDAAQKKMIEWLVTKKIGEARTTYKLRDWLFSRQRYWGEPFPIAHDAAGKPHLLAESDLPILLPDLQEYRPTGTGESPLANATQWLTYKDPKSGQAWRRETNTMPQWAGSCWYYLRFIDPTNDREPWNAAKERYWMPVDLYVGGAEHAVLHLLYARFWHKVLYDLGHVTTKEPFQRLVNQGMILGENGEKMSKSRGNSVNPDDIVRDYGADTFRLYEMFMGPLEATKPWKTEGLLGCQRFLSRIWRLVHERVLPAANNTAAVTQGIVALGIVSQDIERLLHRTIQKVTDDTEAMRFNTAISAMMELVNGLYKTEGPLPASLAKTLAQLLGPYAPHMAEELWELLGGTDSIAYVDWPKYDPSLTVDESQTLSIQVNGKLRGTVTVAIGTPEAIAVEAALAVPGIDKYFEGKPIKRKIYVAGKIINFVV